MPHKFDHLKDKPNARRGKRRRPPHIRAISKERLDELTGGSAGTDTRSKPVYNEFIRLLCGFSQQAIEVMQKYGLGNLTEDGQVPVGFTGVSQSPRTEIGLTKPSVARTRAGIVVISGLVAASDLGEIGKTDNPVRQVDVPSLETHTAAHRFNVGLGRPAGDFQDVELARTLSGAALQLSAVVKINGYNVSGWGYRNTEYLWNRPPRQPSSY